MSYKIQYGESTKYPVIRKRTNISWIRIVLVILSLLAVIAVGRKQIISILIPGDDDITTHAYVEFTKELDAGESFADAFVVFCKEIIASEV